MISDGEETIRSAVAFVFPGVPHQLCQFHDLKDATKPLYEADQHVKTQLKKQLRGVRPIERALEEHKTPENDAMPSWPCELLCSMTPTTHSVSSTLCLWLDCLQLFHTPALGWSGVELTFILSQTREQFLFILLFSVERY